MKTSTHLAPAARSTGRRRPLVAAAALAVVGLAPLLTSCTPSGTTAEAMASASLMRRIGYPGMTSTQFECAAERTVQGAVGDYYRGQCNSANGNVSTSSFYWGSSDRATDGSSGNDASVTATRGGRSLTCWFKRDDQGRWTTSECGDLK